MLSGKLGNGGLSPCLTITVPHYSEQHILAGAPTLRLLIFVLLVIGVALIASGVFLVYLGAHGDTEIVLFGNTFKSQNVGVVGIFCGAVMAILSTRRVLLTIERLGRM